MIETLLWIVLAAIAAIGFFRLIEDWAEIGDRIDEGTDPKEHDEWPT